MVMLRPVLMSRVRLLVHAPGMGNGDVRVGARYGAIDISHEKMAAEKRTNLSTPEHLIFARQLDGDS